MTALAHATWTLAGAAPALAAFAIAAATPWGLSRWALAVGTRAAPADATRAPAALLAALAPLLLLQLTCGVSALGVAGGLFVVAAAWMLIGWCFVLALNLAPARTLRASRGLGLAGIAACAAVLSAHALGALPGQ
ncbi:hypothetical protein [Mitsuaria sp. GD03876]|uniref:hypothetical protein n=1 Tax=Mitsuaria sp. GD03876 TaxID=2975399 RepID=UPI00244C6883|nr:hypothetical protein [Mitsuaria sp. GD03876]MDH0865862.1 hypothetical protein [Mitsuaria sp. GD03876]